MKNNKNWALLMEKGLKWRSARITALKKAITYLQKHRAGKNTDDIIASHKSHIARLGSEIENGM